MTEQQPQTSSIPKPPGSISAVASDEIARHQSVLDQAFGPLDSSFSEFSWDGFLCNTLGKSIATNIPSHNERMRLWRLLLELQARASPGFMTSTALCWEGQWKELAQAKDHAQMLDALPKATKGELLGDTMVVLERVTSLLEFLDRAHVYAKGIPSPFSMNTTKVIEFIDDLKTAMEDALNDDNALPCDNPSEGFLGPDGNGWRDFSLESLHRLYPDKSQRIAQSVEFLRFVCASCCEYEDRRHLADVFGNALIEDLSIHRAQIVDRLFDTMFPLDRKGRPRLIEVP